MPDIQSEEMQFYWDKLKDMGIRFQKLFEEKKYPQAKYLYDSAQRIAVFLDLPRKEMRILFGNGEGNEDEENTELFRRDYLEYIDWKCCIFQHKTYQDVALRRAGEPVKYYSDEDFCAICRQQKRAT